MDLYKQTPRLYRRDSSVHSTTAHMAYSGAKSTTIMRCDLGYGWPNKVSFEYGARDLPPTGPPSGEAAGDTLVGTSSPTDASMGTVNGA